MAETDYPTPEEIYNNPPDQEDEYVVTEYTFSSKGMKPVNLDDAAPNDYT